MRIQNPSFEAREKLFGLLSVEFVNVLRKRAQSIDAFPACDRIGAHNWMNRRQLCADILRSTAWSFMYKDVFRVGRSSFKESVSDESRSQALEEFAVWLGKAVMGVSRPAGSTKQAIITNRSYNSYPEAHSVSPPELGNFVRRREV
jgi:hypothetical protein